ncbi:hypothetical protein M8J77_014521 [Diaphorina citri]|nr:hypothetical protein M8J77_014521 [Diaphorina citri]
MLRVIYTLACSGRNLAWRTAVRLDRKSETLTTYLMKVKTEVLILHIWIWSVSCIVLPEPALSPVMSSYASHNDSPEGYYAFIESAKAEPPAVRPPPYFKSKQMCPGLLSGGKNQILHNLCGDLNKGVIPANPMRQNIFGSPYPL